MENNRHESRWNAHAIFICSLKYPQSKTNYIVNHFFKKDGIEFVEIEDEQHRTNSVPLKRLKLVIKQGGAMATGGKLDGVNWIITGK